MQRRRRRAPGTWRDAVRPGHAARQRDGRRRRGGVAAPEHRRKFHHRRRRRRHPRRAGQCRRGRQSGAQSLTHPQGTKMSQYELFKQECRAEIAAQGADQSLAAATRDWMNKANARKYSYHFEWMGRPIIQYPQDIVAMQELIWSVQPDLIVETGIAHGGSLIFSASMLELNAACGGPQDAEVVGVDIDIRAHNREAIEAHPLFKRISMIQGSSIAPEIVEQAKTRAAHKRRVLVCLDSNHTHDHVLAELNAY